MTTSDRTRITRLREKSSTDRAALDALLDSAYVGHVGLVRDDGTPVVLPTAVARDGDDVLIHGSTGSPWLRMIVDGAPVCLTVTAVDGLVVARSAFESSMHYRSAVLFGACSLLGGAPQERALDLFTESLLPGRAAEIRRPTRRELQATVVLALPIEEWSLKVSAGWPDDPPEDVEGDAWAGVVPLESRLGVPRPTPDLRAGIALPPSLA
ncbi:MAG: pyridoxamine 5'-phosphate oxidase family protein [Jatrophihabitans sp.]